MSRDTQIKVAGAVVAISLISGALYLMSAKIAQMKESTRPAEIGSPTNSTESHPANFTDQDIQAEVMATVQAAKPRDEKPNRTTGAFNLKNEFANNIYLIQKMHHLPPWIFLSTPGGLSAFNTTSQEWRTAFAGPELILDPWHIHKDAMYFVREKKILRIDQDLKSFVQVEFPGAIRVGFFRDNISVEGEGGIWSLDPQLNPIEQLAIAESKLDPTRKLAISADFFGFLYNSKSSQVPIVILYDRKEKTVKQLKQIEGESALGPLFSFQDLNKDSVQIYNSDDYSGSEFRYDLVANAWTKSQRAGPFTAPAKGKGVVWVGSSYDLSGASTFVVKYIKDANEDWKNHLLYSSPQFTDGLMIGENLYLGSDTGLTVVPLNSKKYTTFTPSEGANGTIAIDKNDGELYEENGLLSFNPPQAPQTETAEPEGESN